MTGSTVNLQNGDGWTHLQNLETLQNMQVDGNLTVLGTITGVVELTQMQVMTSITTVGNGTLTAAALAGGFINRSGPIAAFTDTTDTAAAIVAAFPGAVANSTIVVNIKNGNAFIQTLAAGSGVTIPLTKINPSFSESNYLITLTNVTPGSEAVTFAHINTNPIVSAPSIANPYATAINTVGAGVLTAASFVGGLISRGGSQTGTPFTDTTDTAAAIIAACPSLVNKIGTSMFVEYTNTTNAVATVTGGTGVTVSGTATVPASTSAQFLLTYTAAATITMVGTGTTSIASGALYLAGSSSGQTLLQPTAVASGTLTLPAATDQLVGRATTDTLTNKTLTDVINTDCVRGSAFTSVSTTTLATVTGLSVALTSAGTYAIEGSFPSITAVNAGGLNAQFIASNSLSLTSANITAQTYNGTTLAANTNVTALGSDFCTIANTVTALTFSGTLVVNAAGTLNIQAAQHTSNASTTTINAGSFMRLTRIS